jgi:mono/diheme cytochrome c family protein
MKRRTKVALGLLILAGIGGISASLFIGPRMRTQVNIRPFQAVFPAMPAGLAPYAVAAGPPATSQPIEGALAAGKVYYGYYCAFCHGADGRGDGPVGRSYVPQPADLRAGRLSSYSDAQLERAMLTGVGHEPVMERVVYPAYRAPLVQYVRKLASEPNDSQ